jgi:hypothetical protein
VSENVLDKYRVIAQLGRGGMADVYLAAARGPAGFHKLLVVKVLQGNLAREPQFLAMFLDEGRLAARLNHPNVVQTYEIGEFEGRNYITMEYLEGQPLNRIVERFAAGGGLTAAMALRIVIDALAGLHYAHELLDFDGTPLDVVHRDITPQNVFVTYEGQVKVVDFGIAKAVDSSTETMVGIVKGKVAYMAPEQARGEAVDRRADLFSMGVVLWELLSGRRLWEGLTDIAVVGRLVQGDIPELERVRPDLPSALCRTCMRALHPDPEQRPRTALEFQRELESQLELLPTRLGARRIGELVAQAFEVERRQVRTVVQKQLELLAQGRGDTPARGWRLPTAAVGETPILGEGSSVHDAVTALHTGLTQPEVPAAKSGTGQPPAARRAAWGRWLPAIAVGAAGLSVGLFQPWQWSRPPSDVASGVPAPHPGAALAPSLAAAAGAQVAPGDAARCDAPHKPIVELTGEISQNAELRCDKEYLLRFTTFVTAGATLTIEPGTTIRGDLDTKGTLVVQPGGRIQAAGTPARPIVFTSAAPAGQRRAGDWGGVILLGEAPVNLRDAAGHPMQGKVEGITLGGAYGGNSPDDSSGVLRYVRIEYSGSEIAPNNEVNGLTLGGVGRGTILDHIQVRHTADDCFEFFGGTVDAKYLVCQHPDDDAFDWDYGYRGRLQFLVAQAEPKASSGSNGFEGDNDPAGSSNDPVSEPRIYNATLCGKNRNVDGEHYGVLLRRGSRLVLRNSLFMGFSAGLDVRDARTRPDIASSLFYANLQHNLAFPEISGAKGGRVHRELVDDDRGFDEQAYLQHAQLKNREVDPKLGGCFDARQPGLRPHHALLDGASTPPDDGFFDPNARYIGAFRDREDRWDEEGWLVWGE